MATGMRSNNACIDAEASVTPSRSKSAASPTRNVMSAGNPSNSGMMYVSDPSRNDTPSICFRHSDAQCSASSLDGITLLRLQRMPGHGWSLRSSTTYPNGRLAVAAAVLRLSSIIELAAASCLSRSATRLRIASSSPPASCTAIWDMVVSLIVVSVPLSIVVGFRTTWKPVRASRQRLCWRRR